MKIGNCKKEYCACEYCGYHNKNASSNRCWKCGRTVRFKYVPKDKNKDSE